jgi:adenine-specific DNA-methyltransferase
VFLSLQTRQIFESFATLGAVAANRYRHQRWRQFYPLWVDPERQIVVRAGESLPLGGEPLLERCDGLVPLWPIDSEGNHRCWRLIPATMQSLIQEGRVVLGRYNAERQTWTVNLWVRKSEARKPKTVWWDTRHDAGTHGTTLLNKVLGRRDAFPFPKSVYAVRDTIAAVVRNRPHALILDFFAGSGTTLHAVAMLNAADGGERQCILVTNNEVFDRRAQTLKSAGTHPGSEEWEKEGICRAVTWPRLRAVITGQREDGAPLEGDWTTGRLVRKEVTRTIRPLSFTKPENLTSASARRAFASTLGVVRDALANCGSWYIAGANSRDPVGNQAVLFDPEEIEAFAQALATDGQHIRTISLSMPEDRAFTKARRLISENLPVLVELAEESRPMAEGLVANLDYLRLDFLDPDALELGGRFGDLLPALWLMAGARGPIPTASGDEDFIFPETCRFGVLLREKAFRRFNSALHKKPDIEWAFIITDSREAFVELNEKLPPHIPVRQRVHLYRHYLDNFQINRAGDEA